MVCSYSKTMRRFCAFLLSGLMLHFNAEAKIDSPNGIISLAVSDTTWTIAYNQKPVLTITSLGFDSRATMPTPVFIKRLSDRYDMISGKRRHCRNEANEYRAKLALDTDVVIRLYNDGIAFRYELTNLEESAIPTEHTTYRIAEGTRRWMQQWADSYEGFFPMSTTARVKPVPSYSKVSKSPDGFNCRWGFPALVEPVDDVFVLLTESNIEKQQSASCLYNDGESFRVVPDKNESRPNGQWHSPWRIAIVGTLADLIESTLVTDVAMPCQLKDTSWIKPGTVSWIYWAHNHGSSDYRIICQYVDMAETLKLPYVLIDAEWDQMKDGHTIEEAIAYARSKGIRPLIWYNSSVGWVDGAPTPKYRLNKPEDREREFAWCERLGVAGVKIDFFSGDDLRNMDYCLDLLECASRHQLLVNFHGATIPRGWQRTYPNLLTTEGVYGAEWYNNVPTFTTAAASHNATLPFTRNVIGPMDYTPCTFSDSQHPHITTKAHELALTVLFESGLQHLADRPESYLCQPDEVKQFFGQLPAAWDDTRYVGGYPGRFAILARRSGTTWYVAGINGTDQQASFPLSFSFLEQKPTNIRLFADATDGDWLIEQQPSLPDSIECKPRGGFLLQIE